jgi:tetratricopeptide (TPR) repeat protein
VPLGDYLRRFDAAPIGLLDAGKDAAADYHDRLTVAKTFALAIEEAKALHPCAEPLIVHAALLAPEPIPLFFLEELWGRLPFSHEVGEGGERSEPDEGQPSPDPAPPDGPHPTLASRGPPSPASGRGEAREDLEEALAALRTFALIDREDVPDERDPAVTTAAIRLHRLVRIVAATLPLPPKPVERRASLKTPYGGGGPGRGREDAFRALTLAMRAVYPDGVYDDPKTWPRARRLDALAMALVGGDEPGAGAESEAADRLDRLGTYRQAALGAYAAARPLFEKALKLAEAHFGPDHTETAKYLSNLALVLKDLGGAENLALARAHLARALAIDEAALGPEHPSVAIDLSNLARVLKDLGGDENLRDARENFVRAEKILRGALGEEHPLTQKIAGHYARFRAEHGEG